MNAPPSSPTYRIPNLQAELDEVVSYLGDYETFRTRLWRKLWFNWYNKTVFRMAFHPIQYFRWTRGVLRGSGRQDLLSGKTPDFFKSIYAEASDTDKSSEFYEICCGDYSLHALSLKLLSRFPDYEFEKLAQFHDALEVNLRFTPWQTIGFIV